MFPKCNVYAEVKSTIRVASFRLPEVLGAFHVPGTGRVLPLCGIHPGWYTNTFLRRGVREILTDWPRSPPLLPRLQTVSHRSGMRLAQGVGLAASAQPQRLWPACGFSVSRTYWQFAPACSGASLESQLCDARVFLDWWEALLDSSGSKALDQVLPSAIFSKDPVG